MIKIVKQPFVVDEIAYFEAPIRNMWYALFAMLMKLLRKS